MLKFSRLVARTLTPSATAQNAGGDAAHVADHVLAVIQNQKESPPFEKCQQGLQ